MVIVKEMDVERIKPNNYNPNRMTDSQFKSLVHNIKKDKAMLQPILIDQNFVIIDGEHRWRASKEAGLDKIWVVVVESKEEEAKLRTISFNNIKGDFEAIFLEEILNDLSKSIEIDDLSLLTSFDPTDLRAMIDDFNFDSLGDLEFEGDDEDDEEFNLGDEEENYESEDEEEPEEESEEDEEETPKKRNETLNIDKGQVQFKIDTSPKKLNELNRLLNLVRKNPKHVKDNNVQILIDALRAYLDLIKEKD